MPEPVDMIIPMLRERRAELAGLSRTVDRRLDAVDKRLESIEAAQNSFRQASSADSLSSKLVTGEFQQRGVLLEERVERLEAAR